jgi:hypothetical protein
LNCERSPRACGTGAARLFAEIFILPFAGALGYFWLETCSEAAAIPR